MGDYRSTNTYTSTWHLENDDVISDSSDECPSRIIIDLTTDDADQQFWGDNELDSTSLSDIEGEGTKRRQCYRPFLSHFSNIPTAEINRLHITESTHINSKEKRNQVKYSAEQQLASTSITSDPLLYQQSISTMSTQLSNLTRKQHGGRSRTRIPDCAPIRVRYLAAKRAREAEIYSLQVSSSSDSESPKERPIRKRLRSFSLMSDDDQVTMLPGDKCPNCNMRPKNAIIVHGKIGHQCFCYQCSMKLMRSNGKCAMCNRNIRKVVKNVVVKELDHSLMEAS